MFVAIRWHGVANATPWTTGWQLFATPGNSFAISYCCFIFVDKERSPEILVQLNFGLCEIIEDQSFPVHTLST